MIMEVDQGARSPLICGTGVSACPDIGPPSQAGVNAAGGGLLCTPFHLRGAVLRQLRSPGSGIRSPELPPEGHHDQGLRRSLRRHHESGRKTGPAPPGRGSRYPPTPVHAAGQPETGQEPMTHRLERSGADNMPGGGDGGCADPLRVSPDPWGPERAVGFSARPAENTVREFSTEAEPIPNGDR